MIYSSSCNSKPIRFSFFFFFKTHINIDFLGFFFFLHMINGHRDLIKIANERLNAIAYICDSDYIWPKNAKANVSSELLNIN